MLKFKTFLFKRDLQIIYMSIDVKLKSTKSWAIAFIIYFWMWTKLFIYVLYFIFFNFTSTNWTFFYFRNLKLNSASVFIFFSFSRHKPISMNTNEMKPVIALIYSCQIESVRESLLLLIIFITELFKAHSASSFHCVIICWNYFSHFLV